MVSISLNQTFFSLPLQLLPFWRCPPCQFRLVGAGEREPVSDVSVYLAIMLRETEMVVTAIVDVSTLQ